MKINRQLFLDAVRKASSAIKTRTTLPVLSHLLLTDKLSVTGTDIDLYVKASCECEGEIEPVCVPSYALLAALSYGTEMCEVTVKAERIRVSCGPSLTIATIPADEFPKWPDEKFVPFGVNPVDLAQCIESVAWAADTKSTRGPLYESVLVRLKTKDKAIVCAAMTGTVFGYIKKPAIVPDAEFMFLATCAPQVIEAMKGEGAEVSLSPSFLRVTSPEFSVCVKLVEGSWPNIKELLTQERTPIGKVDVEAITTQLKTIMAISNNESLTVKVDTDKSGMALDFRSKTNTLQHTLGSDYGKSSFCISAEKWRQVLEHTNGDTTLSVNHSSLKVDCGDFSGVIALIHNQ